MTLSTIEYLQMSRQLDVPLNGLLFKALYNKGTSCRHGFTAESEAIERLLEGLDLQTSYTEKLARKAGVPAGKIEFWITRDSENPRLVWVNCKVS